MKLEIKPRDGENSTYPFVLTVDGLVKHVGSYEDCAQRYRIYGDGGTRLAQDKALHRLFR